MRRLFDNSSRSADITTRPFMAFCRLSKLDRIIFVNLRNKCVLLYYTWYPTPKTNDWLIGYQHIKVNLWQLRGWVTGSGSQRWSPRYNALYLMLHNDNATQFTVKPCSYTNATTSYVIEWFAYLLIITLAPSPITTLILHTLFGIIWPGVDAVLWPEHIQDSSHLCT